MTKSSTDSLSSADTQISIGKKSARAVSPAPPPPPPPPPISHQAYDATDEANIEIEVFESEPKRYETKSKTQQTAGTKQTSQTTQTHRKSVSFDLSDNEYIPVFAPESEPSDNITELFLSQFSRENSQEDNDGYEVPIKYPSGPRSKPKQQVKSILRSPSPNSKAPTTPSSLDRPLRTAYITPPSSTTKATVHTVTHSSDDEIERENPFRKEFLGPRANENIYEELDFECQTNKNVDIIIATDSKAKPTDTKPDSNSTKKLRPKSAYSFGEMAENSRILTKTHQSNDTLNETKPESAALSQSMSRSTGLISDRPKQKPPLPPKPPKPSPSVIKHADLKQNEALKAFQEEMLRGDLYEFVHDAQTNQITKIKQNSTHIPDALTQPDAVSTIVHEVKPSPVEDKSTESPRINTFNPSSPLPPIPKPNVPPYSKVYKRGTSIERPTVSPPPPPVNMSTLPSLDKIKPIHFTDSPIVEILASSRDDIHKYHFEVYQENASEYSLVTEETHREILLQENELRNAMQQEQTVSETTSSRIPVRKAPLPPNQHNQHHHQPKNTSISSNVCQESSATTQSFPVTQILPVQYSHLPTPQQPDYFLTFPPPQTSCNVIPMPQPGAFSTFMVSDKSAPQTTNIAANIMCHAQQMPMYLQRPFISVPVPVSISTIHNINQSEPKVQHQNMHNNGVQTQVQPSHFVFGSDAYRHIYKKEQQQRQHYHYQNQSLSTSEQDTHSQSASNNPHPNEANIHGDCVNRYSEFSTETVVDSQFSHNRSIDYDVQLSSASGRSSEKSISHLTSNYPNPSIVSENSPNESQHTFTTFGKQTQV